MPQRPVVVDGARELRRTLRRAGADMGDLKAVHREVASIVQAAGASGAPVRTGRLSGTVRTGATLSAAVVKAGYKRVPYAQPIHWGWFRRGIRPNPWLSRAAQQTEPRWFARYAAGIERIIDKIKGA